MQTPSRARAARWQKRPLTALRPRPNTWCAVCRRLARRTQLLPPPLVLAVSLAVVAAGTCAASIGLLLPWMLSRAGVDPAFGSGPLATIIQDVLSLINYFAVVVLVVT